MSKILTVVFLLSVTFSFGAQAKQREPDYAESTGRDWLFNHDIADKKYSGEQKEEPDFDLFFFYPTAVMTTNAPGCVDGVCDIDDPTLRGIDPTWCSQGYGASNVWDFTGAVFGDFTRVYVPYYRQTPTEFEKALTLIDRKTASERLADYVYDHAPYADATNALTHYFTVINPDQGDGKRRPFILAGHSHGSCMLRLVMERFFTNDVQRAWLKHMIACYAVGCGIGPDVEKTIRNLAGVPFATNSTDTGVYIMWNTEGVETPKDKVSPLWPTNAVASINPISWTREPGAYAPAALNLGGWTTNEPHTIAAGLYDASNYVEHSTIVCSSKLMGPNQFSLEGGTNSLHNWDYRLYWNNVRANAFTRYATYANLKPVDATAIPSAEGTTWKVEVKGDDEQWREATKNPVDGQYYVSGSTAPENVRLNYTLDDPSSGMRFVNGEITTSFPMSCGGSFWKTTATEAEIKLATKTGSPSVQLGIVAQRYPWNGMLDIRYKTLYANANYSVTFKADGETIGTAKGTGGKETVASIDLANTSLVGKQLKSVKITATLGKQE